MKYYIIAFSLLLCILFILSIGVFATNIPPSTAYKISVNKIFATEVFNPQWKPLIETIIWEIRIPRALLAIICGAGLSICGVLMQSVTKNPIADPYILGLASGASTGAVFVIILGGASVGVASSIREGAFLGAIVCSILIFIIGTQYGKSSSTTRLILSGLAISTIFSALTDLLISMAENSNQVKSALFWSMGSLGGATWDILLLPIIALLITIILSISISKSLDLLLFGDDNALMLGMNVNTIKSIVVILTSLLTSVLVAVTGAIGFVGLIVPHLTRLVCGNNHKKLILLSSIIGAIFLLCCDVFAKNIAYPKDIPIGIITSLIGGPFFLWMLTRSNYSFKKSRS